MMCFLISLARKLPYSSRSRSWSWDWRRSRSRSLSLAAMSGSESGSVLGYGLHLPTTATATATATLSRPLICQAAWRAPNNEMKRSERWWMSTMWTWRYQAAGQYGESCAYINPKPEPYRGLMKSSPKTNATCARAAAAAAAEGYVKRPQSAC